MQDMEWNEKQQSESGMMVVEATLSFTVFIMVVVAIIYLVNIFTLHNKVQFAINSAAHEIASYSYLYSALGIKGAEATLDEDGRPHTAPIDETANQVVESINKIEGLAGTIGGTVDSMENLELDAGSISEVKNQIDKIKTDTVNTAESVKASANSLKGLFSNPKSMLVGIIYIGAYEVGYEVKSAAGSAAARGLTEKYLEQGGKSADEFLQSYGVTEGYAGLDFSGSTLFCDSDSKKGGRMVDIVVSYDIDMSFLSFILPEPKLHVVQRVSVAGWVDGDGEHPEEYGVTKV